MELFQLNQRKKLKNVNSSRPQNNIDNQDSPQSLESSRATIDITTMVGFCVYIRLVNESSRVSSGGGPTRPGGLWVKFIN